MEKPVQKIGFFKKSSLLLLDIFTDPQPIHSYLHNAKHKQHSYRYTKHMHTKLFSIKISLY